MPNTWLCTFEVKVDFPTDLTPQEMERAVADCLAVRLPALGFAGNCIVTLTATAGNVSVHNTVDQILPGVIRIDTPPLADTPAPGIDGLDPTIIQS